MSDAVLRSQWTTDPAGVALRTMGATAKKAADTWTVQEWAGRLAARAGPRDYVGQLRELYDDVMRRWRYVQEDGERVPGTPRALLGHVLGAWYNAGPHCRTPEHCDVERTQWNERGWGDCDDVATLLAAGAISMGMRPQFRVVRFRGGAHVSTLVTTPKGETVNVDPVGEPDHKFGWAMPGNVQLFDMEGRAAASLGGPMPAQPYIVSSSHDLGHYEGPTYMAGLGQTATLDTPHVVLTRPGDTRGARVLAIPTWHYKMIARGVVEDGMPAIDQFGDVYEYMRGADVWAPIGACGDGDPMGRRRRRRRRRRRKFGRRLRRAGRRLAKRIAKIGRGKVARLYRKAAQRLLRSKIVQEAAAKGLQALGIPPQVTKAVLAREAELAKRGGRARVAQLISEGKTKQAAALIAQVTGTGLRAAVPSRALSMSGQISRPVQALIDAEDDNEQGIEFVISEGGREYPVAPVAGFERVGGWYGFGQLDVSDTASPDTVGRYYRIQKGDTLFALITKVYGIPAGQARLKKARVVNDIAYNFRFHTKAPSGEAGYWKNEGNTRISFMPRYSCEPEEQVLDPTGGEGSCYPIIYFPVTTEEPPPYEPPAPPPEEPIEPEEPEEPVVVIPEEPEPVEPEPVVPEPEPPPVIPEPIVPVVAPIEPTPPVPEPTPPVVEPSVEPTVEPPTPAVVEPVTPKVVTCLPGFKYDPASGQCVTMCPEGYVYDPGTNTCKSIAAPECPQGYKYDAVNKQCVPVAPLLPPPAIEEPEPLPIVEPPVAPPPTPPKNGAGLWVAAIAASVATGTPIPLAVAAFMEKAK